MFWHSIWRSAGRPLNTELHIIMKKEPISLSDKEKQKNERHNKDESCINNNGDIFQEIK